MVSRENDLPPDSLDCDCLHFDFHYEYEYVTSGEGIDEVTERKTTRRFVHIPGRDEPVEINFDNED